VLTVEHAFFLFDARLTQQQFKCTFLQKKMYMAHWKVAKIVRPQVIFGKIRRDCNELKDSFTNYVYFRYSRIYLRFFQNLCQVKSLIFWWSHLLMLKKLELEYYFEFLTSPQCLFYFQVFFSFKHHGIWHNYYL